MSLQIEAETEGKSCHAGSLQTVRRTTRRELEEARRAKEAARQAEFMAFSSHRTFELIGKPSALPVHDPCLKLSACLQTR